MARSKSHNSSQTAGCAGQQNVADNWLALALNETGRRARDGTSGHAGRYPVAKRCGHEACAKGVVGMAVSELIFV